MKVEKSIAQFLAFDPLNAIDTGAKWQYDDVDESWLLAGNGLHICAIAFVPGFNVDVLPVLTFDRPIVWDWFGWILKL